MSDTTQAEASAALIELNTLAEGFIASQPSMAAEKPFWDRREAARKTLRAFITERPDAEPVGFVDPYMLNRLREGKEPVAKLYAKAGPKHGSTQPLFASPPVSNGSSQEFPSVTAAAETPPLGCPKEYAGPFFAYDFMPQKIMLRSDVGNSMALDVLQVRGWGYLTGHGQYALKINPKAAAEIQDNFGKWVAQTLNAELTRQPVETPPLTETWETACAWLETTFGPIKPERIITRAKEEFDELEAETDLERQTIEAADVVMCLMRFPGLWDALVRKMAVNRGREWALRGDGTGYHVKRQPAESANTAQTDRDKSRDEQQNLSSPDTVTDTDRMNWLEMQVVEVGWPLIYGSRSNFIASPTFDDGGDEVSDLRTKIDAALNGGEHGR